MPRDYTVAKNHTKEYEEKVIKITRVSKKTKGGNKIGFTALVVVGDKRGKVGVALGKANDVLSAIKKGVRKAKKRLVKIPIVNDTIPHELMIKNGASKIILKPAPKGTGVIAGGSIRAVLELAGVKNIVAKMLGTNNKLSNVTTTFKALKIMSSVVDTKKKLGQMPEQHPKTTPSTTPSKTSNSSKKSSKSAKTTKSTKTTKSKSSAKQSKSQKPLKSKSTNKKTKDTKTTTTTTKSKESKKPNKPKESKEPKQSKKTGATKSSKSAKTTKTSEKSSKKGDSKK